MNTPMPDAASPPPLVTHRLEGLRVTYRDTDRMSYAYHSQYLVWFEMGRTELLRSLGTSYRTWEDEHHVYLPVRSVEVQYHQPARYDDELVVITEMIRLTRASVTFRYILCRLTDPTPLATGATVHAFVNDEGRIVRLADRLLPQFF